MISILKESKSSAIFFTLLTICIIALAVYVLGTKEAKAHRAEWQLSPRLATCEKVVEYMNLEGIHDEFTVIPDPNGGYRVIFED